MKIFLAIHAHIVFKVVQLVLGITVLTEANIGENQIFVYNLLGTAEGRQFQHLISQQFGMKQTSVRCIIFYGAFYFTITEFREKHYLFKYSGYF